MMTLEQVIDTRSIDMTTGKAIPGTGESRKCDLCGANHEVWVYLNDGKKRVIVGTTCARERGYAGRFPQVTILRKVTGVDQFGRDYVTAERYWPTAGIWLDDIDWYATEQEMLASTLKRFKSVRFMETA